MTKPTETTLGVFLDSDTVDQNDIDFSRLESTLPAWRFHNLTPADSPRAQIAEASVVVSNKVMLDDVVLKSVTGLQLVCIAATGTNNIDLQAAERLGIRVCNVRGYATPSVTQHVFSLILSLSVNLEPYHQAVKKGRWQQSPHFCLLDYPIREIAGRTLGIIGYGELGHAVAKVAEAFGMQVLIAQRPGMPLQAGRTPLPELLKQSDIVSLHCPLTDQTRGLIGAYELSLMKPSALLINTARGGIVDEGALAAALRQGQLAGAGIDVLSTEPPPGDNPLLQVDIPNLIVTPHIAWASRESRQRLVNEIAVNIRAFLNGEPRNLVSG